MAIDFSPLFADAQGNPTGNVPESCIESAEYIIQCIANGTTYSWVANQPPRNPHVIAHLGNGKTINISTQRDLLEAAELSCSYNFNGLPKLGQGLICVNRTTRDIKPYNMHLGAVIATEMGGSKSRPVISKVLISEISEVNPSNVQMIQLDASNTKWYSSVAEFRGNLYDENCFALGLLAPCEAVGGDRLQ